MITEMDPKRFVTFSLRDERVLRILSAALQAVEPGRVVQRYVETHPLPRRSRAHALAVGKAAAAMLGGLASRVELQDALVITKEIPQDFSYRIIQGGHPVPTEGSLRAGAAALEFAAVLGEADLLVCLISGGGSALMTAPCIPLEELQQLTKALLASGARIDEINILRRHLDRVKGGGLAAAARAARVTSLILSDVVGNPLEAIASGPTAPDATTKADAIAVLNKYGLEWRLSEKLQGAMQETLKPGDRIFRRVGNHILADNGTALQAAGQQAEKEGIRIEVISRSLQVEARQVGRELGKRLREEAKKSESPFCLLAGGETTVTVRGSGRGGRNQEMALAAMQELAGLEKVLLVSLATDGEDGPTDAAGAVVTGQSYNRATRLGLNIEAALDHNDSYPVFEGLGDLIKTGPTGTNVNDLVLLLRL